jgi:conjugative transfer signal peptidase TraF
MSLKRKILNSFGYFIFFSALILGIGKLEEYFILYNGTASVPVGYYFSIPTKDIKVGDLFAITIADKYMQIIRKLGYPANGHLLLKRVIGVEGDVIEIAKSGVLVNNILVKNSQSQEMIRGIKLSPLPVGYHHKLISGEFWVMGDVNNSYDSRYFGVVNTKQVLKKAIYLF